VIITSNPGISYSPMLSKGTPQALSSSIGWCGFSENIFRSQNANLDVFNLDFVTVRSTAEKKLQILWRKKNCKKVFRTGNRSGVDVMITIFGDYWQFSAKNWRFSQKLMLWSKFCII
jgi:hypothetical protein